MRIALLLLIVLFWSVQPVGGAESVPAPPMPSIPPPSDVPSPETTPLPPRDPGIVKQPETVPLPGSVVVPPAVDPKMAVNPDEPKQQEPAVPPEREQDQRQSEGQSR
jgi:hypothetical protein